MAKETPRITADSTTAPQCISFSIDKLPVELVHMICVHLKPTDLASVRLASRRCAPIALQYMVPEAHLVLAKDSFEQLKALAEHPIASKYVTSIFFEADKVGVLSRKRWEKHCFMPGYVARSKELGKRGHSCANATRSDSSKSNSTSRRQCAKEQVEYAYGKYTELLHFQRDSQQEAAQEKEIAEAMKHFPNLKGLAISTTLDEFDPSPKLKKILEPAFYKYYVPSDHLDRPGLQQMRSLLLGTQAAGLKVESLHCERVCWRILDQDSETFARMRDAISNVKDLRLGFANCIFQGNNEDEQCFLHLEKGWLKTFVTAAPNLHRLEISFELDGNWVERFEWAPHQIDIVGEQFWPYLHTVELDGMKTKEDHLISFCSRHASTLKSLALSDMVLEQGSWFSTFDRVRRALNKLNMFTVNGEFDDDGGLWCDFNNDECTFGEPGLPTGSVLKQGIEAYFQRPYDTDEEPIEEFLADFRRRLNTPESDLDNTNDDLWYDADIGFDGFYDPVWEDRLE